MIYYLAGPMTNRPQFNYPLFDRVTKELRDAGLDVRSPAEMDSKETRKMAMASKDGSLGSGVCNNETWGDFLSRDVKMIADSDIDSIILLPEWYDSKGARLEVFVAMTLGYPIYLFDTNPDALIELPYAFVLGQMEAGLLEKEAA